MSIDHELLGILCDPITKEPVELLRQDRLERLNAAIRGGQAKDVEGNVLQDPVEEALITKDGATIYRIERGIPIMLAEQGIPTAQITDF